MEIAEGASVALNAFFSQSRKFQTEELLLLAHVKKARGAIR
jgi:hypothetical protein